MNWSQHGTDVLVYSRPTSAACRIIGTPVKGRWIAALMVVGGLLATATIPAAVCAMPMPIDCCPAEAPPQCVAQNALGTSNDTSLLCCASSAVAIATVGPRKPQLLLLDHAPDPLLSVPFVLPPRSQSTARAGPDPVAADYRFDASLTYLRTSRLRI